jgi:hypothetical protein
MSRNNKNAYVGMNTEQLIKNSICDHPDVIKKLKDKFNIKGSFENASSSGIYRDNKADIRINFTCGHYLDANIKSFKKEGFNQIHRASVSNFCKEFNLDMENEKELENIIVAKSKNPRGNPLFPEEKLKKWNSFFVKNVRKLLKWGFSKMPSREILVLYNNDNSVAKIYAMQDVLNKLPTNIIFTKGGFNIGDSISFQRKGGNGSLNSKYHKTDIKHPGNDVQLKVKPSKLINTLESVKLAEYVI